MHQSNAALFLFLKITVKANKERLFMHCFSKRRERFEGEMRVSKYFSAIRISIDLQ